MQIERVEAIPVSVPVETAYETSLTAGDNGDRSYDHLVVRLHTDGGITGVGEIAPTPYWPHGLTQTACRAIIEETLAPTLEGRSIDRIGRIIEELEHAISGEPFPLYGIDVALHDALGKRDGRPVYDLLGGPIEDRTFDLHYSIGIMDTEATREEAKKADQNGFDAFKIKVGGPDPVAEQESLAAIREAVPDARIRVDANQAWTADEAIRTIPKLNAAADGLVLVEQPVPYDDVRGLKRVKDAVEPLILADESCFSPSDAAEIARRNAADILNIKLAKTGGMYRGRALAHVADAHGLTCFMGSMVELGIGTAANAHFRVATPEITYPTGVLNLHAESSLVANDEPWQPTDGTFTVPEQPGLGIELDADALARYRID
ncbi:MAG: mandelate racemase/muconate lactonizing enzyme family protein [Halobacteriales archaeon]